MTATLAIALVRDVFHDDTGRERLRDRLLQAKAAGADLAMLPELAVLPWVPATRVARAEDAEPPGGPRHCMQAELAADVGIGLLGGAIVQNAAGARHNTALLFGPDGACLHTYAKIHIPDEPGFWESDHYESDPTPPIPTDALGMRLGFQICSDNNRPFGCHVLGAQGAEVILNPRATEPSTYRTWRAIWQANALTSSAWILSVNRPSPEAGVPIGGPSIAVAPDGTVVLETEDDVAVVTVDRAAVLTARRDYPGYLEVPADLYARAWAAVTPRPAHGPLPAD